MSDDKDDKDDKAKPIETQPMVLNGPPDATTTLIDPSSQTEVGLKLLEERVRVARQQIKIVIKLTTPAQWVVMDGGDGRESVYATGGASDRILRLGYGMRWGAWEISITKKEVTKNGETETETECRAEADLLKENGDLYERYTGMRVIGGFVRNERDLEKGAKENAKHLAVTDILGLRFLSKADYKDIGLDLDKMDRRADFQTRGEDVGADVPRVGFGKNKGRPITELVDKSLEWYIEAAKKTIADPDKKKWHAKEKVWLNGLLAEEQRRKQPKKPKEETAPEKPAEPQVDATTGEVSGGKWDGVGPPPMTDEQLAELDESREPGSGG